MKFLKKLTAACRAFVAALRTPDQTPPQDAQTPCTLRVMHDGAYTPMHAVRAVGLQVLCECDDGQRLVSEADCEDGVQWRALWLEFTNGGEGMRWASDGAPARPW